MRLSLILLSLCFLSIWAAITTTFIMTEEVEMVEVNCYDNYGNEIQDLVCNEERGSNFGLSYGQNILLISVYLINMFIFFSGLALMSFGLALPKRDVVKEEKVA